MEISTDATVQHSQGVKGITFPIEILTGGWRSQEEGSLIKLIEILSL